MDKVDQHIIYKAFEDFQKRLRTYVATAGGHFVHKMWTFIIYNILYIFPYIIVWNSAVFFCQFFR